MKAVKVVDPVTTITVTTVIEKSLTLDECQIRDILREHFKMPRALVSFNTTSYGDFQDVTMLERTVEEASE
jgi:hypothetical protein